MKLSLKNLRFSRWTWIALILVGVALLAWLILLMVGTFEPTQLGERKVDPNRCPHCNYPLTPYSKQTGECLYCHGKLRPEDSATKKFLKLAIPITLFGLFGILLTINVVVFVRSLLRGQVEDSFFHTYCRKCRRKVRFRPRQCGQFAKCPGCKQLMRFPEAAEPIQGRWQRVKSWFRPRKKNTVLEDSA